MWPGSTSFLQLDIHRAGSLAQAAAQFMQLWIRPRHLDLGLAALSGGRGTVGQANVTRFERVTVPARAGGPPPAWPTTRARRCAARPAAPPHIEPTGDETAGDAGNRRGRDVEQAARPPIRLAVAYGGSRGTSRGSRLASLKSPAPLLPAAPRAAQRESRARSSTRP